MAAAASAAPSARRRVAVVGAGVSGLVAALRIATSAAAADVEIAVFDKGRTPGGRMATRRPGQRTAAPEGLQFDHGAQYFTTRDAELQAAVTRWEAARVVGRWEGVVGEAEWPVKAWREKDAASQPARFVGTPGMSAVPEALSAELSATGRASLRLLVQVTALSRLPSRRLELFGAPSDEAKAAQQGAPLSLGEFDAVVLALPAPQAAKLAEGVAPQMASSLSAAPLEGCWCAMLAFASRAPLPFDGLFVNGAAAPLSWVARDSSKPRRPQVADCWVLHSSRAFFKEHSELDPVAAADRLAADFRALAAGLDVQLPQLVFATAHRWRFAFAPENAIRGAVWDADLALAACGDWARGGRVEGAFLAGVEAAKRVLEALKQPPAQ